MNQKSFVQFVVAIGLAGLGLAIVWGMLGVGPAQAQGPDDWEKAKLYGAQVELHNLVMADNGDLYLCLHNVGYGVYKLAKGATQWQVLESTGDGCMSMALDKVNDKLYRLASKNQYLWRSDDGGLNWTKVYTPSDPWYGEVLAINPVTPSILHMAYDRTIHRSEDSGVSWTQAQFSLDGGTTYTNSLNSRIFRIAVDPSNPQYVYLTLYSNDTEDDKGIYVSANGGLSYTRVITFEPWGYDLKVNTNGTVFASYNDGFWRSTDHGQTWDPLDITVCTGDPNPHSVDYITFHPTLNQTVFIMPQYGGCRSDDEGDTWTGNQEYWDAPLIDPSDTSTWYVPGTPGLWKSTDAWSTWSEMNEGLSEVDVRRIATSPSNLDRYWVMTGNGVGFTEDGGDTWAFPLRIYEGRTLESIDTWILTSNGGQVVFHPTDHNTVYLTQDEYFYQFSNWTVTPWGEITPTLAITINAAKPELSAQDLVFDPTNPATGYLAAGHIFASYSEDGDGVYKTTDGGQTWNTTSLTLPIRSLLLVTHTTGITLYAGTIDAEGIPGRIYRSTDDGDSWQMVEEFSGRSITTMAADPRQPLRVFAGTAGEGSSIGAFLYISQDGGETWSLADVAWPGCGGWIGNVVIDPKNPDHIYYAHATNGNICNSFDGGQTWENPSLFIWAQQWGIGQAQVVDINHLPPGGSGLSVQAGETITQSLMYMGATSGVYRRILTDEEGIYLPIILKAAS